MANDIPVTVFGNLTADPELKFLPSGSAVCNFTIASTPRHFDKDSQQWVDDEPTFMRCSVFGDHAENIAGSLVKGTRTMAYGNLVTRSWEDKDTGQKRSVMEMKVIEVGPTLRFATATVLKVDSRASQQQQPQGGGWGGQQPPQQGGWGGQQGPPPTWGAPGPGQQPSPAPAQAPQQGGWGAPPAQQPPPQQGNPGDWGGGWGQQQDAPPY